VNVGAQRVVWIVVLFGVGCSLAAGQDYRYSGEVYGGAGCGKFYDDEGSLGTGPTYRAGAGWRLTRHLGIQGELVGIHHARRDNFRVQGNAWSAFGNVLYYFSTSKVQPYVLGGLGALNTTYHFSFPQVPGLPENSVSRTDLAIALGAGARVFLSRRWSLDPQFRLAGSSPGG
jgi:opacity protein-like surface antigen